MSSISRKGFALSAFLSVASEFLSVASEIGGMWRRRGDHEEGVCGAEGAIMSEEGPSGVRSEGAILILSENKSKYRTRIPRSHEYVAFILMFLCLGTKRGGT